MSTTVEENARDAPAGSCRAGSSSPTIATVLEKLQSALQKSRIDRTTTGTGLYGACRSTQCCLAVWSRWVESSTRLGGFRALKKTTVAPYTTKVNYRSRTSRGPTRECRVRVQCLIIHLKYSKVYVSKKLRRPCTFSSRLRTCVARRSQSMQLCNALCRDEREGRP